MTNRVPSRRRMRLRPAGTAPPQGDVPRPRVVGDKVQLFDDEDIVAALAGDANPPQDARQLMQQKASALVAFTFADRPTTTQDVEDFGIFLQFTGERFGYDYELQKVVQPNNAPTLLISAARKVVAHQQYLRGEVSAAVEGVDFDKIQFCLDGLERNRLMREEVLPFLLAMEAQDSHYYDYLDKTVRSINDNGLAVALRRNTRVSLKFDDLITYLSHDAEQAQQTRLDNQKRDEKTTAEADARWQNAIAQGQVPGHAGPPLNPPSPAPGSPPAGGVTTVGPGLQGPPSTIPGQAQPPKPPRTRRSRTRTSG